MNLIKFKLEIECEITQQDIDDLMTTALEGGINYWCSNAEVVEFPSDVDEFTTKLMTSDMISRGGTIELTDADDDTDKPETWLLSRDRFISGVKQYMLANSYSSVEDLIEDHDADTADAIVQYALFNDLVFC